MPDTMMLRLNAQRAMTPKAGEGFNVVGVDSFEEAGDELYLVAHFDTRVEAERKVESYQKSTMDRIHIYGQSGPGLKKARKARGGAYHVRIVLPSGKLKHFYDRGAYERWCDRNDIEPHVTGEGKLRDAADRRGHALVSDGPPQAATYGWDKLEDDVPGPKPGARRMERLQGKMTNGDYAALGAAFMSAKKEPGALPPRRPSSHSRTPTQARTSERGRQRTGELRVRPGAPRRNENTGSVFDRRHTPSPGLTRRHGRTVSRHTRIPHSPPRRATDVHRGRMSAPMMDTDFAQLGAAFMSAKQSRSILPTRRMGGLPQRLRDRRAARAQAQHELPKTGQAKMSDYNRVRAAQAGEGRSRMGRVDRSPRRSLGRTIQHATPRHRGDRPPPSMSGAPERAHRQLPSAPQPPRKRSRTKPLATSRRLHAAMARSDLVRPDLKKHTESQLVYRTPQSRKISLEW